MKQIAVVLAGCGFKDGSEITEAVSTLISLSEFGVEYQCFAPHLEIEAKNNITNTEMGQKRNVLIEAARISRGQIKDIRELKSEEFDGLVFPGGFGVATHLCNFAQKGSKAEVHPEVSRVIQSFHAESKPICAICIAPSLLALTLGKEGVTLTLGDDPETIQEIIKTGAQHEECPVEDFVTDRQHKIVTTPAYMYGKAKPYQVFKGIRAALQEFVEMA
ncbi:MAG: isoprenoid biosynthesis glyoxalase ElbB [Bdellovibrionales bacterium]